MLIPRPCSVFWDLYCAAPERRETCDHSSEAKAFHDYVSNAQAKYKYNKKLTFLTLTILTPFRVL